ncbi:MAG TPA: amidohydrolase family protein [Bryobacteraceae bacterium]|nr:amidohydrolase family protein [Bryobacteraceae bacterium]
MAELIALKSGLTLEDPPNPPLPSRVVLVSGRKIQDICSASDIPASARVIDLGDATLLPGLIDAHVHLTLCGCQMPRQTMMQEGRDTLLLRAAENARTLLRAGITTARDCGDRDGVTFALRAAIENGVIAGPHLLLCGSPLTSPRGHCYFMGGEVEGAAGIARAIRARAQLGGDFIKVMATGGGLTPGTDSLSMQFSAEEIGLIVSEAERHGLYVAAHAHSAESIRTSIAAGVRTIEHCTFVEHRRVAADLDTVRAMSARNAVAVPTNIPAALAIQNGRTLGLAKQIEMASDDFLYGRRIATQQLIGAGVRVIAGTDAGATGVTFDALAGEIEILQETSGSALQAIASATSLSADSLGLSGVGRIRRGFESDLIAVSGNPAEDVTVLRRPIFVMSKGAIVRSELA